jgi:outer membrane protein assembly factor BamD
MKVRFILIIITVSAFTLLTGCKSEYEKIRQSNDPELMYKKGLELYDEEEYERAQVLLEQSISAYRGQKEAEELFFK